MGLVEEEEMTNISHLKIRLAGIRRATGYIGDKKVHVPWDDQSQQKVRGSAPKGGELSVRFRDLGTFHLRRIFDMNKHRVDPKYPFPKVMNLGPQIWGSDAGVEVVVNAAHDAEQKFIEELGVEGYNKEMNKQMHHLEKIYGKDPYNHPDYLDDFSWAGRQHGITEEEFPGFRQHRTDLYNQERGTTDLDPEIENVIDKAIENDMSVDDLRSINVPEDVINRIDEETER